MRPKSLKVAFKTQAESAEKAVVQLSDRFLRLTKTGCKIVRQLTEFGLAELCQPLVEDWKSGKVAYANGEITLIFSSGELAAEADLLIYAPEQGDRFLYSKRSSLPTAKPQTAVDNELIIYLFQHLQTTTDTLIELTANQRALESRVQTLLHQEADTDDIQSQEVSIQGAIDKALKAQAAVFAEQLQVALEAQATTFAQILSKQLTSTALHFSKRIDEVEAQLDKLASQLKEIGFEEIEEPQAPQTEAEWLKRFKDTWGTVGDYEQYSFSYREANADTPLCYTPDWVALCELNWAHKLCSTLSFLHQLIHDENGIGYGGADILEHFGRHIDSKTGEQYYIYHRGGFTAYEALWQIASNPQYSWLPELQRLWARLPGRHHDVFQMFGWEQEAIDSLENVVERAYYERQSAQDSQTSQQRKSRDVLGDYLALLNLGPFTPITIESIKKAYKQAMKSAHPDAGGSKEQAQKVNEAYQAVLRHYFPEVT